MKRLLTISIMLLSINVMIFAAKDEEPVKKNIFQKENPFEISKNFVLLPFADVMGGYDNNIFQSPVIVNTSSNNTIAAPYLDLNLGTKARLKLGETEYLALIYSYGRVGYLNYPDNKMRTHTINLDYYKKASATFKWKWNTDIRRKDKTGTSINGNPLAQQYSYWSFKSGPAFYFTLKPKKAGSKVKKTRILISYVQKYYNYDEPGGTLNSLDFLEEYLKVGLTPYLGTRLKLAIDISQRLRHYQNSLAKETNGVDNTSSILRQKYYTSLSFTPQLQLKKGLDLYLGYEFKYRLDPYQGYYSYMSHTISSGIQWELDNKLVIELDGDYEWRNYIVKVNPTPSGGTLYNQYYQIAVDADYPIIPWLHIFIHGEYDNKDSNAEDVTRTVLQPYQQLKISGGAKFKI